MTINEGMVWQKTLQQRHNELVSLRNQNSATQTRYIGHTDKEVVTTPTYDVKALDKLITGVAKEMRLLEMAIKATNGMTPLVNYTPNDDVLADISE